MPAGAEIPSGFSFVQELGQGLQKKVYLAFDTCLEREVAVLVYDVASLVEAESWLREARAMARVSDHPNVASIFAVEEGENHHCLICQYLPGGTLADLIQDRAPLIIADLVSLASKVAAALDYTHSRGLCHRDLKPANILLNEERTPFVADFGLSSAGDSLGSGLGGNLIGTPAYMSPEQATGAEATAASDVYSLGCVLYEMATGNPPFPGSNSARVLNNHINVEPVHPGVLNNQLPASLDDLIIQMLAKSPAIRPSAAEVVERLDAFSAADPSTPQVVIEKEPLIGRDDELRFIQRRVMSAGAGGVVLWLSGEAGIGKTTLAREVTGAARSNGAVCGVGLSYPGKGVPPFWPWTSALRALSQEAPVQPIYADFLRREEPIMRLLQFGVFDVSDTSEFRLFDSVMKFLKACAQQVQTLVLLEDVDRADTDSLRLIQFTASQLDSTRVHLICTERTQPGVASNCAELREEISRLPWGECIDLQLLPEERSKEMVRALDRNIDQRRLNNIVRLATGNPLFLKELVRLKEPGDGSTLLMSQTIVQVLDRRLTQLNDIQRSLLSAASVLGEQAKQSSLARMLDLDRLEVETQLGHSAVSGILPKIGPDRYRFRHALIRERLYNLLDRIEAMRLHARAGELLLKEHRNDLAPYYAEIAQHLLNSGQYSDTEKTFEMLISAGEQALERMAAKEAIELLQNADEIATAEPRFDDAALCRLNLLIGQATYLLEGTDAATPRFQTCLELAENTGNTLAYADAVLGMCGIGRIFRPHYQEIAGLLRNALDSLDTGEPVRRIMLLSRLASLPEAYSRQGAGEEAVRIAQEAQLGSQAMGYALHGLHTALARPEQLARRIEIAEQLLDIGIQADDPMISCEGADLLIVDALEAGDLQTAERTLRLLASYDKRLGGTGNHLRVRAAIATIHGELEAAEEHANAYAESRGDTNTFLTYVAQLYLIRRQQGRLEELLPAQIQLAEQYPRMRSIACAAALTYALCGKLDEARHEFELLARADFKDIVVDAAWSTCVFALAETCALIGDQRCAELLYQMLLPFESVNLVLGNAALFCHGSHALGMLAGALSQLQDAQRYYSQALGVYEDMNAEPLIARARDEMNRLELRMDQQMIRADLT